MEKTDDLPAGPMLYLGRAPGQYGLAGRNRQAAEQRDGRIPRGIRVVSGTAGRGVHRGKSRLAGAGGPGHHGGPQYPISIPGKLLQRPDHRGTV